MVWNVMLQGNICNCDDANDPTSRACDNEDDLKALNAVMRAVHQGVQEFRDTSDLWGGAKSPTATVVAAAFSYFFLEETMEALAVFPWVEPQNVQLFVRQEDDEVFSLYMLRDGVWVCVYEPPE